MYLKKQLFQRLVHSMDENFKSDESLYRAVLPKDMFWKKDGTLSSAAFFDKKGLSVDRGYYRPDIEVVDFMHEILNGSIVSFKVEECNQVNAKVKYLPSRNNKYHSEVHGKETKELSNKQRKYLATHAKIVAK